MLKNSNYFINKINLLNYILIGEPWSNEFTWPLKDSRAKNIIKHEDKETQNSYKTASNMTESTNIQLKYNKWF